MNQDQRKRGTAGTDGILLLDSLAQTGDTFIVDGVINREQVIDYPEREELHLRPFTELRSNAGRSIPVYWGTSHIEEPGSDAVEIGDVLLYNPEYTKQLRGRFLLKKQACPPELTAKILKKEPIHLSPAMKCESILEEAGILHEAFYTHVEEGLHYQNILLTSSPVRCEPPLCGVHLG